MLVHAAGESSPGRLPSDTHAVVLTVPGEDSLRQLLVHLHDAGVEVCPVYEPDPPYGGALMALGLRPRRREELKSTRRWLAELRLLS